MPRLNFLKLTCERKQDVTGWDEIELYCGDERQWGASFKKNQWHNMQPDGCNFEETLEVQLREYNGSNYKSLGKFTIQPDDLGQDTHEFKTSGARYVFDYSVTAT